MSRTLQLFLLEVALLGLSVVLGVILVGVGWFLGWLGWLSWRLVYLAWAGHPRESYDVEDWPDDPSRSRSTRDT